MPEENQNMGKSVSMLNNSSLRDYADSIVAFQNQARQEQMAKASVESDNNIKNLMTSGMTTTNHGVAQDCSRAARIGLVAKGIRDYFALPENGGKDYSNVPDVDLVDGYKASNPDSEKPIWKFVLDKSQICDPNPLYQELGFYGEPQVEDTTSVNVEESDSLGEEMFGMWLKSLIDSMGAANDTALGLPRFTSNVGADIAAESIKFFGGDEERANEAAEKVKSFWDKFSFGDKESLSYNTTKMATDLILAYYMGKELLPQSNIGNLGRGTKSILGAAQGAGDMALYSMISDQELPSKTDLNIGMGVGAFLPYGGLLLKGGRNLLKSVGKKEIENAIPKVSKLTETRQDKFLKEFDQPFEEWMRERNLTTYDDVKNYFDASKKTKLEVLKQIKGRYKAKEVDDVLDWCVDYAQRTDDPRLNEFLELQAKNNEGGLEMWESEKVKQYFGDKGVFNFDSTKTSEDVDKMTNWYEKLMNWQRKVAKENGFDNLAEINNEIQAGWYLNRYVRDLTKIGKKGMSLLDFFIAASTGDWKTAAGYLLSKRILSGAKTNEKYAKLLQWLFNNGNGDKLVVDYEKIQAMQSEKEVMEYLKSLGIYDDALPYIEGGVNDAGKTRIIDNNTYIGTPDGKTIIKDKITEIPQSTK